MIMKYLEKFVNEIKFLYDRLRLEITHRLIRMTIFRSYISFVLDF